MRPLPAVLTALVAVGLLAAPAAGDLVLNYKFDESSSGTDPAADSGAVAPPANGAFQAGATRTGNTPAGFSRGALDAVIDGYANGGDADKLDGLSMLTLSAWINLQGAPANGNRVFAKQLGTGNFDGFSFAMSTPNAGTIGANNFALNLALGGSSFGFNRSTTDLNADNRWIFVAATYDGAGNVQFYSGDPTTAVTPLGSAVLSGTNPPSLTPNSNEFRVATSSVSGVSAPIFIDDVRVYNEVLSADAIDAVRRENVPEPAGLGVLALAGFTALRRRASTLPR